MRRSDARFQSYSRYKLLSLRKMKIIVQYFDLPHGNYFGHPTCFGNLSLQAWSQLSFFAWDSSYKFDFSNINANFPFSSFFLDFWISNLVSKRPFQIWNFFSCLSFQLELHSFTLQISKECHDHLPKEEGSPCGKSHLGIHTQGGHHISVQFFFSIFSPFSFVLLILLQLHLNVGADFV